MELAELAAGLPMAASFAMAGGISAFREGRRRAALNRAVHELRRPLQAIALAAPGSSGRVEAFESSLWMAAAAVDRLDREINGRPAGTATGQVRFRGLVEAGVERWRTRAALEGRGLSLVWTAGEPQLSADAVELTQAVDNLISNGLDHGEGEVAIEVLRVDRAVQLVVRNRKRDRPGRSRREWCELGARFSGRRRHGHGLRIVQRVAARAGGRFRLRRRGEAVEALLELPLQGDPG